MLIAAIPQQQQQQQQHHYVLVHALGSFNSQTQLHLSG
jgi:hypothetical protein